MLGRVACFAGLGGWLFGFDLGLIGGALLDIRDQFGLRDGGAELVVGAAKAGAFVGTFFGGALMLCYGRRVAIALDSLFFVVGPVIMAAAANTTALVVGRAIVGFGIGISAVVVPAYLGELAPAAVRGRVVEVYEVLLCVGMLMAALSDAALQHVPGNWRWMVGLPVVPALVLTLSLCVLPESPRWLVIRGRLDEALAVMHKVHTSRTLPSGVQNSTAEVEAELMDLWSSVEKDKHAAEERRRQHAAEREGREVKLTAMSSSSLAAAAAGAGGSQYKGGWAQLQQEPEADPVLLQGRQEQRSAAATPPTPATAGGEPAAAAVGEGQAGAAGSERQLLLDRQLSSSSSSGIVTIPTEAVLAVPPALRRIRTRSDLGDMSSELGDLQEVQTSSAAASVAPSIRSSRQGTPQPRPPRPPLLPAHQPRSHLPEARPSAAAAAAEAGSAGAGLGEEHGLLTARHGAGQLGFWRTLRDMMLDIWIVARGPERRALQMALWLAFFNQAFASTAIINYAPQVLEHAGVDSHSAASLYTSAVGASKMLGVLLSFLLVDSLGRRPLLVWGSAGCSASLAGLMFADWADAHALVVAGMCTFIFAFSISWAGVFWVLLSELFSMSTKSPAASAATAVLFLTGAVTDLLFLSLHDWLGPFVFLLFALVAGVAGVYVATVLPETKGRSLQEVQQLVSEAQGSSSLAAGVPLAGVELHAMAREERW